MAANKSRPFNLVKQTSKTILFEKFNSTSADLYTILNNEDIKKKEKLFKTIEENLEVRSFEEFSKKFMPTVWEWTESTGDSDKPIEFHYSMEKPVGIPNAHSMNLDKNEFYSMVMRLYQKKGNSGDSNLEFDYSDVEKFLSPKKVLERAMQLRKDLEYNYSKMLSLGEGSKQEKNNCITKINTIRKEIISQYKESFTGALKLALADTENKLMYLGQNEKTADPDEKENKPQPCLVGFKDDGSLDIRLIEMQDNNTDIPEINNNNSKLLQLVEDDYNKHSEDGNLFVKEIITSTYCNKQVGVLKEESRIKLEKDCNTFTNLYQNAQEQFIRAISSAIEKVLNVKAFFEQASVSANKKIPASLIISNCSAESLLDEKVKSKFEYFIKESSRELDEGKIWFAIVPAIGDSAFIDNIDEEVSLDDIDMETNAYNVKTCDGDELTSLAALNEMLGILKDARITTFFNFRANETTGFENFCEEIVETYRSKLESINGNSYAVFSYPNFTVLPKKETYIRIGTLRKDFSEKSVYIDVPGIYIDSSYVAAGLVVASQNPDYLIDKYSSSRVNPEYPCVRYDFERNNNRFIMATKMNRECKTLWASEAENNISKDKFGFCFCGNKTYYDNQLVNNSYVFTARNMCKENDGQYEPIYKRLTMDFVTHYLRTKSSSAVGNSVKISDVEQFIKDDVGQWMRDASSENYENNILRSSGDVTESISIDNNSGKLKIKFLDKETDMDIDIIKE